MHNPDGPAVPGLIWASRGFGSAFMKIGALEIPRVAKRVTSGGQDESCEEVRGTVSSVRKAQKTVLLQQASEGTRR